ncbi:MAG: MtrB/PioB family outer membrane beta-barrel protein, partial [Gammaproteobacteria bacterium]|nr:MtrB/PioB family outer membrane beta-barrel protein [Gammaproteobacteria bacterium]
EEKMNKLSVNLTASPGGLFQLSYDGSYETFDNHARNYLMGDFAANFGGFFNAASANKDLHFVPDSTLMTHAIRLSKAYGATTVAAGYGMSRLEQDSFTIRQTLAGYTTGEVSTDNAFLNVNHRVSPALGLEGYIKYANRDNDSTFPAPGLISATEDQTLGVRINSVESFSYGLSATMRALPLKSSLTGGWKREDIDRDLTWTDTSLESGIAPQRSLYREETVSDEVYLKWIARPMPGVSLRITPSYLWADKTGLVTEPEESLNLKAAVSYAAADGMQVNGYYNYKHRQNGNNTFTNALANDGLGTAQAQEMDNTFHSAGASLNLTPAEQISASVSLDWTQNDFESYFFSTARRRYEIGSLNTNVLNFLIRDTSTYKVDTWSLSFNGDWQASDRLKLNAGYTYSMSEGDVASGLIATELAGTIDGRIDNTLHSFILGANYGLKKNTTLRAGYMYDNYDDSVYDALSGGVHTLMAGVSFAL